MYHNNSSALAHAVQHLADRGVCTDPADMAGPTSTSNWVIKGMILCGDYPKGAKLNRLLSEGIDHFVDLRNNAENYLVASGAASEIQYTHYDLSLKVSSVHGTDIADTALMLKGLIADCLLNNRVAYIHCTDGHNLTTVAVCGVLSFVYGVSGMKASAIAAQLHGCRKDNEGVHQHLTTAQKAYVKDLAMDTNPFPTNLFGSFTGQSTGSTPVSSPTRSRSPTQPVPPTMSAGDLSSGYAASTGGNSPVRSAPMSGAGTPHHGRFEHTKGSGGGFTSINLFGGSDQQPTPTKRTGRAPVPGMSPDYPKQQQRNHMDPHSLMQQHQHQEPQHHHQHTTSSPFGNSTTSTASRHTGAQQQPFYQSGQSTPTFQNPAFDMNPGQQHRSSLTQSTASSSLANSPVAPRATNPPHADPQPQPMVSGSVETEFGPYELPPPIDPKKEPEVARGPTPSTNWVVRDQVLCGPMPHPAQKDFRYLVQQRFDTFVVLTEANEAYTYLPQYENKARIRCDVVHYPMVDGAPLPRNSGDKFLDFVEDLGARVESGEKIYIHCKEGHGRTGMVVAALLALLYDLGGMKALNLCDALHECRTGDSDRRSPDTQEQRTSVLAVLPAGTSPPPSSRRQ